MIERRPSERLGYCLLLPQAQGREPLKPAEEGEPQRYGVAEIVNREAGTLVFTS